MPLISNNRGGGIIIQNWNTKNDIPSGIENINLPIIVDRSKIQHRLPDAKERLENEKNKKDELYDNYLNWFYLNLNFKIEINCFFNTTFKFCILKFLNINKVNDPIL